MDFDPRDYDSRDDDRYGVDREHGSRGDSDDGRDWDDWRQPESRDHDADARDLGRGPGDDSRNSDSDRHGHDPRHDARWPDRDRDGREREFDPLDVFTREVHLPRGLGRDIVRYRDREYTLRGSEFRTLATVGAFRVVREAPGAPCRRFVAPLTRPTRSRTAKQLSERRCMSSLVQQRPPIHPR